MTSVESAVQEFLLACEADGLKESTIRWYRSILGQFSKRHGHLASKEMTAHEMRQYLSALRKREYSPDTVDDVTRALHRFWKWTAQEYNLLNPMRNIRYPEQPKPKKPKAASLETVIAMFDATAGGMNTTRDRAILAFTLDSGCRAGGICTLRTENMDLENGFATVIEKGDKERTVYFRPVTRALLQDWMNEREKEVDEFFYNVYTLEALRPNSLYLLFKRLARRAGVKGASNPHSLRHRFSIEFLKNGGSIVFLARILGHDSVDTTARHYAFFMNEEVQEAHSKFSPLNHLNLFKQEN